MKNLTTHWCPWLVALVATFLFSLSFVGCSADEQDGTDEKSAVILPVDDDADDDTMIDDDTFDDDGTDDDASDDDTSDDDVVDDDVDDDTSDDDIDDDIDDDVDDDTDPCPDGCLIDSVCFAAGATVGNCLICDPTNSNSAWTPNDGAACSDGEFCTGADVCESGDCVVHAGNPCDAWETCNELTDTCDIVIIPTTTTTTMVPTTTTTTEPPATTTTSVPATTSTTTTTMSSTCVDADGDGYSPTDGACGQIDCNDQNATVHPNAPELCDGLDNDCVSGQVTGQSLIATCGYLYVDYDSSIDAVTLKGDGYGAYFYVAHFEDAGPPSLYHYRNMSSVPLNTGWFYFTGYGNKFTFSENNQQTGWMYLVSSPALDNTELDPDGIIVNTAKINYYDEGTGEALEILSRTPQGPDCNELVSIIYEDNSESLADNGNDAYSQVEALYYCEHDLVFDWTHSQLCDWDSPWATLKACLQGWDFIFYAPVVGCSTNAQCSDNLACNGGETCVSGACVDGVDWCDVGETCAESTPSPICTPGGFGDTGAISDLGNSIAIDWPVVGNTIYGLVNGTFDIATWGATTRVWVFYDGIGVGNSALFSATALNSIAALSEVTATKFNLFVCINGGTSVCTDADRKWVDIDAPWALTGLTTVHDGSNQWFVR